VNASRIALALAVCAACVACNVAGPVVDRLPEPPLPGPIDYRIGSVSCYEPPPCEIGVVLESELTELRPLNAAIEELDDDAGSEDVLDPDAIDWEDERIILASAAPIDVVRDDAPEAGTLIELRGPVTLRFQNIASLEGLRIAGASAESRLVLEHVTALDLTLGDSDHRFAGRLEAKNTAFERASVNAAHVQLGSSALVESLVAAETFVSRDVIMENVVLEVGDGLFAPSELRYVEIRRCDALSFFESDLRNVAIPRCRGDAPTRFYGTDIFRSVIDGSLSADSSSLEAVRVGRRQDTSLLMWNTILIGITFCDFADEVQFVPGKTQCSSCTDGALETVVCKLPKEAVDGMVSSEPRNFCERIDEAVGCEEPLPARPRPHGSE
jgi:hypothetical protein